MGSQENLQSVLEAGATAFGCFSKFEVCRFKALKHCNMLTFEVTKSPPSTRSSEAMYTTLLDSDCTLCHGRHTSLGHRSYLVHYAALPFKCTHGIKIKGMSVSEPEERMDPFIDMPSTIHHIEPDCFSESSGGITNS